MTLQEFADNINSAPDFLKTYGSLELKIEGKSIEEVNYYIVPDIGSPYPARHMNMTLSKI